MLNRILKVGMVLLLGAAGCSDSKSDSDDGIDGFGLEGPIGKADNAGVPGISVDYDSSETQVWAVRNQWEETNTEEAQKEGVAWPANSGLNWDQKYSKWVESLVKIPSSTFGDTF